MKNSEMLFTPELLDVYDFSFGNSTRINEKYVLVIDFKQKSGITDPFYHGQLYIDAETLAMTKAVFQLNMENEEEVSKMFVRKKPAKADVSINEAAYTIHYRQKDGKWYYGYGKIDLAVKVNWKKKWFNSLYKLNVEMAITDWRKNSSNEILKPKERLKSSVVLSDAASGFSDKPSSSVSLQLNVKHIVNRRISDSINCLFILYNVLMIIVLILIPLF